MTTLGQAAAAWADTKIADTAPDLMVLHLADTIAAGIAGSAVGTGGPDFLPGAGVLDSMARLVAAIRSTEVDDIHLAACVTPGAIVVPSVLALIDTGDAAGETLAPALAAGYAAMVGFGLGIGGPGALYRGIWPTLAVAPLGAAVAAGRALGLSPDGMLHALAMAAPFVNGRLGHSAGGAPSRWFLVGEAVRAGVTAALAARAGYHGDPRVLADLQPAPVADPLGEVSFKPACAAKQTIAALTAFRSLLADGLNPNAIESIVVAVPPAYRGMIASLPADMADRLGMITSVAYQLAIAAYAPDRLLDLNRAAPAEMRIMALAAKVTVIADDGLSAAYPNLWPARLIVRTAESLYEAAIQRAPGDPGTGFSRMDLAAKMAGLLRANALLPFADDLIVDCTAALNCPEQAISLARRTLRQPLPA